MDLSQAFHVEMTFSVTENVKCCSENGVKPFTKHTAYWLALIHSTGSSNQGSLKDSFDYHIIKMKVVYMIQHLCTLASFRYFCIL